MIFEKDELDPINVEKEFFNSINKINYFPFIYLSEEYINFICEKVTEIFLLEPNVLSLDTPITICGDTHGQFPDTLRIFDVIGKPDEKKYLFLGDYVDRGSQSIENIIFLFTLKVNHPNSIFLLRGNHETEEISTVYGLRDECLRRYGFFIYSKFMMAFDSMPFAALVSKTIFCVHGGISSEKVTIAELNDIKRPLELSSSNIITDLLWSDPNSEVEGFQQSPRGVSNLFGLKEAHNFLDLNNLSLLIRSHEFCIDGVTFPFGKDGGVITIFSSSNYCRTKNTSAVVNINENNILQFILFKPL